MNRGTHSPGINRRRGTVPDRQLRKRAQPTGVSEALPLVHITPVGVANEIVKSRKIEARHCKVFGVNLVYFFVMRPAYRMRNGEKKSHQINRFPFVFVADASAVEAPYHVYPFDTGGAVNGVFDELADPYVCLEDYELEPNYSAVAGQIGWAFGSVATYFDGEVRKDILQEVPRHETVTRSFVDITRLARSGSNQPDKRASAIEVASRHDVNLKGNIRLAILPKQYLEDPSSNNVDFMERLKEEDIEWKVYNWQPNTTPDEFQDEIAQIARAWFKENGFL